jgi:poly-gamma-glutamate capsule biosynthesis protein CapA/YwtB (metallophosphatase superfamily)
MLKLAKIVPVALLILAATLIVLALKYKPKPNLSGSSRLPNTTASQPKTTTLFFAGDIMLSRNVDRRIVQTNDFNLPFENVVGEIKNSDIVFANLESPFNDTGAHFVDGSLVFDADPKAISGLNFAGFDILSTANNHALDQGQKGVDYTYNILNQNNILPLGTGPNCHAGQIITKNNIKFGFLGYSYTAHNSGGTDSPDPSVCDANDLKQLTKDVLTLKSQVDYLIVSTHMGVEYTRTPTSAQTNFAHTAVDAGADLVIGNHPHWIQPIEQYQGKWIFYAMGNFVFDQMWSEDTREGLTATLTFENKNPSKIELKPVIIDDYCCPRWANEQETNSILSKINPIANTGIIFENGQVSDNWKTALIR